jgi:hypothetical protein
LCSVSFQLVVLCVYANKYSQCIILVKNHAWRWPEKWAETCRMIKIWIKAWKTINRGCVQWSSTNFCPFNKPITALSRTSKEQSRLDPTIKQHEDDIAYKTVYQGVTDCTEEKGQPHSSETMGTCFRTAWPKHTLIMRKFRQYFRLGENLVHYLH